jgi:nucleotide-binding universal stress UspA family protein
MLARLVHSPHHEEALMSARNEMYTIVVAVDYSEASDLALDKALELCAEKSVSTLHAVNVMPTYPPSMAEVVPEILGIAASILAQAAAQLKAHVERRTAAFNQLYPGKGVWSPNHRVMTHQRLVAPAEEIAQLAADVEADLVIVGTHGRRGVSRLVLGSVAEGVVRLAPCPVLVVRKKALPPSLPAIEPPCARCVEARNASDGRETWCEQHRERHGQRHTYYQSDRVGAETNMPLIGRV